MAIKLEGGGSKALVAWPLVDDFFFLRLPFIIWIIYRVCWLCVFRDCGILLI